MDIIDLSTILAFAGGIALGYALGRSRRQTELDILTFRAMAAEQLLADATTRYRRGEGMWIDN